MVHKMLFYACLNIYLFIHPLSLLIDKSGMLSLKYHHDTGCAIAS